MARNLVLFNPADNNWCVDCVVGTIGDSPQYITAYYKTEEEALEAAKSLRERFEIPLNIRIFEYTYAKDEVDMFKLAFLDAAAAVVEYLAE